jgi:hypothetical protein
MALTLLIICHFFTGYGLLKLLHVAPRPLVFFPLAFLSGIAVDSFLPFVLQLCHCPLYPATVFGSLGLVCLLLNMGWLLLLRKDKGNAYLRWKLKRILPRIRIRSYEYPFLVLLGFLVIVSVWRCYYMPPTSRDALSGPEAIAEYAVREHTMINSFFTVDLSTTNNPFKSPFLISLQVIYKMAGFPFGQLWLSIVFVSFSLLLYQLLKQTLHPILAGLLLVLMTMAPELYAYSFMVLYDYSNMVFFFLGIYFIFRTERTAEMSGGIPASATGGPAAGRDHAFLFAALLMGVSTYIRSETLVLVAFFLPLIALKDRRNKTPIGKIVWRGVVFLLPSMLAYFLTTWLYLDYYLPVRYDIGNLTNPHIFRLSELYHVYAEMVTELVTSVWSISLWGYFIILWAVVFLADMLAYRRLSRTSRDWLYAIGVVFFGLGLLRHIFPLMEITQTIKRGFFKLLPLMLLYLANSPLLMELSSRITRWDEKMPSTSDAEPAVR